MAGIWIYAEEQSLAKQLLTAGKELAQKINEPVVAIAIQSDMASALAGAGADKVFHLQAKTDWVENYEKPIAALLQKEEPSVVLIGGSLRGKALAAALAADMQTGLVNSALTLSYSDGAIETSRIMYGGLAVCTEVLSQGCVVTIESHVFEEAQTGQAPGEIAAMEVSLESKVELIRVDPIVHQGEDLQAASTVICVGRGLNGQEDMKLAESLAQKTHGVVGCTRSIAEDYHWLPTEAYIGLSGQKVKPDLYISMGVSGQVQHVAGIRDAKIIVAIDTNENAPIFSAADYGIVGDLHEVVPALIASIVK